MMLRRGVGEIKEGNEGGRKKEVRGKEGSRGRGNGERKENRREEE